MSSIDEYFQRKISYLEEFFSSIEGVTPHKGNPFFGVSFEFIGTKNEVILLLDRLSTSSKFDLGITERDFLENDSIRWFVEVKVSHPNKLEDLLDW